MEGNICSWAIKQIFAKIQRNIIKKTILSNDKEILSEKTNAGGKEIYAQPSNKGEGEGEFLLFLVNTSNKIWINFSNRENFPTTTFRIGKVLSVVQTPKTILVDFWKGSKYSEEGKIFSLNSCLDKCLRCLEGAGRNQKYWKC